MEGLLFEGAYLWREICVSKSIGLALHMEGNLPFLLCFTLYFRAISKNSPPPPGWAYIWRGDLTEGFLSYEFGGLIFGGAYIWRGFHIFGILRYFMRNTYPATPRESRRCTQVMK